MIAKSRLVTLAAIILLSASSIGGTWAQASAAPSPSALATPTPEALPPAQAPDGNERPPSAAPAQAQIQGHVGRGPFGAPQANDARFIQDSAPTMDEYRFVTGSPITFPIQVNRVMGRLDANGYLLDADKLIANGVISQKAHLQLLVWDIDEDYTGSGKVREIDKVYINDQYIGTLSGANETWSVTRLDFDIRYVKFARSTCRETGDSQGQQQLDTCHSAPIPAQNTIRIDIDTGNGGAKIWAVEVDWGAISFDAARPVLFVHGKGGSNAGGGCGMPNHAGDGYDYWDCNDQQYFFGFRGRFSSSGYLTAITQNRLGGNAAIQTNSWILKGIIAELRQRYGVQRINIVAHSKGGLDSRGYISDRKLNPANDVETLVTLATPHHGSYLANVAMNLFPISALFGEFTPANYNLTEEFVDSFNLTHPARDGVRYVSIAADAEFARVLAPWQIAAMPTLNWRLEAPFGWAIMRNSGKYKGANDILVSVPSTKWAGIPGHTAKNSFFIGPYHLNHHSIRAAEKFAGVTDATIVNTVKQWLDIKPDTAAPLSAPEAQIETETERQAARAAVEAMAPQAAATSAPSALTTLNGTITQGQTLVRQVGIDSTTFASIGLLWRNGTMNLSLIDPTGRIINPSTNDPNIRYGASRQGNETHDFLNGYEIYYNIVNPVPGQWKAVIKAAPTLPNGAAQWSLLSTQESSTVLSMATNVGWQRANQQVIVTARTSSSNATLRGTGVRATIIAPSGAVQGLSLVDNGTFGDAAANDGLYSRAFVVREQGRYKIATESTGVGQNGAFKRNAVAELQVGAATAIVQPAGFTDQGVDTNGDGLFDVIRLNIPVRIPGRAQYFISGSLFDSTNRELAWSNANAILDSSSATIALDFDARAIWQKGAQGSFTLRGLRVFNGASSSPLQIDYAAQPYATKWYSTAQLAHAAAGLTGSSTDMGIDSNGNGKFDTLSLSLGVYVERAGTYTWNARLVDANDFEFGWSSATRYLNAGQQMVTVTFDGKAISAHGVNGPYYLKDFAFWGPSGYVTSINAASTQAYTAAAFETEPIAGQPPAAPVNLSAGALSPSEIVLAWSDASGNETGFRVYAGGTFIQSLAANTQSYVVAGLQPNTSYCFTIDAFNDYGSSAPAGPACATTDPSPPSGGNLLVNGGFEQDDNSDNLPDGWALNNKFTRSSNVAHSGNYAAKHESNSNATYRVWQWMPNISPGARYRLEGYVNIPPTSDSFAFRVEVSWWSDGGGTLINTVPVQTFSGPTNGWNLLATDLVAPAGTQSATVRMVLESLNGQIYVDDFAFTPQ